MEKKLKLASLLALFGAASCASLPEIQRGVCGNGVIEAGEDCDTQPAGSCRKAGSAGECRFDCSLDSNNERRACPEGYGCGSDSICRAPSGDFVVAAAKPSEEPTFVMSVADFDGDKRDDLLMVGLNGLGISFFDSKGTPAGQFRMPTAPTIPAVGQLTPDTLADFSIIVSVSPSLAVMRGRSDRVPQPTAYSSLPPPESNAVVKYITIDALPYDPMFQSHWGHEIILLAGDAAHDPLGGGQTLFKLPMDTSEIDGRIGIGRIAEGAGLPCEQFLFAQGGAGVVHVFSPCQHSSGGGYTWNFDLNTHVIEHPLPPIALPGGVSMTDQGVLLADVNADGRLDAVVLGDNFELFVAYGLGDGTFHSSPFLPLPPEIGDSRFSPFPLLNTGGALPYAIADFNEDGSPDGVGRSGISLSRPGAPGLFDQVVTATEEWTLATVADFNGNGILDVAAITASTRQVLFFNGAGGGRFNRFEVPLQGRPNKFAVGDFDGDLLQDIALSEQGPSSDGANRNDNLTILFGEPFGAPAVPVRVGKLSQIDQIAAGNLREPTDGISDLVVLSTSSDGSGELTRSVATFVGASNRQLQSPFNFTEQPRLVVLGQFDDDPSHNDLAVLTSSDFGLFEPQVGGPSMPAPAEPRMFLLPSTGEAEIAAAAKTESDPLPTGFVAAAAQSAAVDLDGDGIDEVVLLGLVGSEDNPGGGVLVARSVRAGDLRAWRFDEPIATAEVFVGDPNFFGGDAVAGTGGVDEGSSSGGPDEPGGGAPDPVSICPEVFPGDCCCDPTDPCNLAGNDFCDEGCLFPDEKDCEGNVGPPPVEPGPNPDDNLALQLQPQVIDVNGDGLKDIVALGLIPDPADPDSATSKVVIFINQGDGTLDVAGRIALRTSTSDFVAGFAVMNADADPEPELALVTIFGDTVIGDIDLDGGFLDTLFEVPLDDFGGAATTGDINTDGVPDLIVSGLSGVSVYLGVPVIP